jgi:hypothetical protein
MLEKGMCKDSSCQDQMRCEYRSAGVGNEKDADGSVVQPSVLSNTSKYYCPYLFKRLDTLVTRLDTPTSGQIKRSCRIDSCFQQSILSI